MKTEIKVGGVYRHFRNKQLYKVIALAKHTETLEDVVVCECLYENPESKIWVRPRSMWFEEVTHEGVKQARFQAVE